MNRARRRREEEAVPRERGTVLPAVPVPGPGGRWDRPAPGLEKGAVLVAVLVLSGLVMAAALAGWCLADARLRAERRDGARFEALLLARAAARGVAGWFEEEERGTLGGRPPGGLGCRERRRVDPDGNGRGVPWREAAPPWNVRWKDPPAVPFRPPDGPAPGDRLAGTLAGPDWVLDAGDGPREKRWLLDRSRLLDPGGRARLVRVALCGPRPGAPPGTLGRVVVVAERPVPGGVPARVRVAGDLVAVPAEGLRRPLVVAGDLRIRGQVSWERGEALVGGDFLAPPGIERGWPAGIPWLAPDRPLRRDNDGDGTGDDADGDGVVDWVAWRDLPGPVPDPWWRARVGGGWPGRFPAPGSCRSPWPFGPRAVPPRPPTREDRSGFFLGCSVNPFPEPVPSGWWRFAGAGVRGTARLVEDPDRPGRFRVDGAGPARPLAALLAETAGLRRLEPVPGRVHPLEIVLDGVVGGLLVRGVAVRARPGSRLVPTARRAPADPADTGGADRPGTPGDPRLSLRDPGGSCAGFVPGDWSDGRALPDPRPCPSRGAALDGVLAVAGDLRLEGGLVVAGQVRAGTLAAGGPAGPVLLVAVPAAGSSPSNRPGIPGAPRVLVTGLRVVP